MPRVARLAVIIITIGEGTVRNRLHYQITEYDHDILIQFVDQMIINSLSSAITGCHYCGIKNHHKQQ